MKSIFLISWLVAGTISHNEVSILDERYAKCQGIDIRELTIKKAHNFFEIGSLTSTQLTECYLKRIKYMNPHLNAILEVNPDAVLLAKILDKNYKDNKSFRGSLHGIPILLKDNIGTCDRMNTTAGARAMLGVRPKADSEVVSKLRRAGAIIIGKATMSEWAGIRSFNSSLGWSGRGGIARNPYVMSETAYGSGSAVAVAANLVLAALGTETDAAIIAPSSICSVVGFKPSVNYTSASGVVPSMPSQTSVGALTRTIEDNIKVTYVITGPVLQKIIQPIRENIKPVKKIRVGILMDPYFNRDVLPEEQKSNLIKLINSLSKTHVIRKSVNIAFPSIFNERRYFVLVSEFKFYLNKYLKEDVDFSATNPHSLQDIINFNKNNTKELESCDQLLLESSQLFGLNLDDKEYIKNLRKNRIGAKKIIRNILKSNKVKVLIAPSNFKPERIVTTPPAIAGYPIMNIPAGIDSKGVPFGLTIYGSKGSEALLLRLGQLFEEKLARPRPRFML